MSGTVIHNFQVRNNVMGVPHAGGDGILFFPVECKKNGHENWESECFP